MFFVAVAQNFVNMTNSTVDPDTNMQYMHTRVDGENQGAYIMEIRADINIEVGVEVDYGRKKRSLPQLESEYVYEVRYQAFNITMENVLSLEF